MKLKFNFTLYAVKFLRISILLLCNYEVSTSQLQRNALQLRSDALQLKSDALQRFHCSPIAKHHFVARVYRCLVDIWSS